MRVFLQLSSLLQSKFPSYFLFTGSIVPTRSTSFSVLSSHGSGARISVPHDCEWIVCANKEDSQIFRKKIHEFNVKANPRLNPFRNQKKVINNSQR